MIVTIDTMAKRYKMLPSEILATASTYDLYVMDAAISYHNYEQYKAQHGKEPMPDYEVDELQAMMDKVKNNG